MSRSQSESISINELRRHLAKYLLMLGEGDRLASIRELAATYHTSVGSISNALNNLEENGSVQIERRGRMGSFLEQRSLGALWTVAETCPLVIGLTLASNLRYEGLATGLKRLLNAAGVEAYMIFIRGSRTRLKALRENRCHIIVMSSFAADELCSKTEKVVLRLPAKSFVSGHRVFYRSQPPELGRPMRVAIDRDSFDQERLTELEFEGPDYELIPVTFAQIHRLLRDGQVDAAVWTPDDMQAYIGQDILDRPLSDRVLEHVDGRDVSAALIARSRHETAQAVIREAIDKDEIMRIQNMVVEGQLVPEY